MSSHAMLKVFWNESFRALLERIARQHAFHKALLSLLTLLAYTAQLSSGSSVTDVFQASQHHHASQRSTRVRSG